MNIFDAVILGIVEGLTEFLPVSSTGHMILAAKLMVLQQTDTLKCFEVVIQLGSILAVVVMFYKRLLVDFKLWCKLVVGFIPTAAIGFLLYKSIKSLFAPQTVAYALIGSPARLMRSRMVARCGEVKRPVRRPPAARRRSVIRAVEVLPLVPVMCTVR